MSEVMKKDDGKVRTDLLPVEPLKGIAAVLTFGAKKYAPNRWRKGMEWSRLYGAVLRHMFAWWAGQDTDPETGLSHLDHAACNLLFLSEYGRTGAGTDDREGKLKDAAVPGPGIPFIENGGVYRQRNGYSIVLFNEMGPPSERWEAAQRFKVGGQGRVGWNPTVYYNCAGQHHKYPEMTLVEKIGKV